MTIPKLPRRRHCDVCGDQEILLGAVVYRRYTVCTCGAGPVDAWTLHTPECDTVPCPFCQLLGEAALVTRGTLAARNPLRLRPEPATTGDGTQTHDAG